ncbi:MAG TPA: rhomboid family intramembrane serine protease [Steroidobacteraceae bacterium]|nr:rhomboid family intramembrane serine protease [Steroidobacteraceae bacterium]
MFSNLPRATRAILAANIIIFALEYVTRDEYLGLFALQPLGPYFHPWQLVTYAFLHGGLAHIFFNMFALYMFGPQLERFFGSGRFTVYYFACVIAAGATQLATTTLTGLDESTIGASGGIFGLLLAFALYFPRQRIMLLLPPIPMPAWVFVLGYGIIELTFGVTGREPGVAHFAHLGGMLGGALVILYWRIRDRTVRPHERGPRSPWDG